MAKKKDKNLVDELKNLENELRENLGKLDADFFDDVNSNKVVKGKIVNYIKQLNKTKKVFDEYEEIAKTIEKIALQEEDETDEITKSVVDLREDKSNKDISKAYFVEDELEKVKEEVYEDKVIVVDGKRITVKQKKSDSNSAKELN